MVLVIPDIGEYTIPKFNYLTAFMYQNILLISENAHGESLSEMLRRITIALTYRRFSWNAWHQAFPAFAIFDRNSMSTAAALL